jgi:hypothetical protein
LVTRVPPEEAVNQPLKVCPDRVGVGSVPKVLPGIRLELAGDTVPPCAFHVTVTGNVVHWAWYVVVVAGAVVGADEPPEEAVNQPLKV